MGVLSKIRKKTISNKRLKIVYLSVRLNQRTGVRARKSPLGDFLTSWVARRHGIFPVRIWWSGL